MKRIIGILFPLFDWLYILQSLEYNSFEFLKWVLKNFFKRGLQKKKILVWTPKIIIILLLTSFLIILNLTFSFYLLIQFLTFNNFIAFLEILLTLQLSFIFIWASNFLLEPIDELIKLVYINQAKQKLTNQPKLIVIGVTGSYGKTSTKEILHALLSSKYKVLKTPFSFNTAVGVAKVIKKDLKLEHEIFIVEMGAYKKGEIKKICELTKPHIGIITGINEQHLDRFKTIENIIAAKTELIDTLPVNGMIALNFDNEYLRNYFKTGLAQQKNLKVVPYAVYEEVTWKAHHIELHIKEGEVKTSFEIKIGSKYEKLQTKLLGEHNVLNLMGALAIAKHLQINPVKFKGLVKKLEPIPHRLQLIPTNNGITVIDDAYSGNPSGFESVLMVLNQFKNHRKIIVTPGIVELGKKEYEIHERLGEKLGNVCDIAILIGKERKDARIKGLISGIEKSNLKKDDLFVVPSLDKAQTQIRKTAQVGDVILFENDLPDQY